MLIYDNVKRIREQIAEAAISSGRRSEDIMLVAASKTKSIEHIRSAISSGVDAIGENRVQEMVKKQGEGAYEGTPLHFIGHLQKNKAKLIVGQCDLIQSADSLDLIERIDKIARALGICQDILIEVNIGRESQKNGVFPEEVDEIIDRARSFSGVGIKGIMAIPPFVPEKGVNRRYFEEMYKLFVDIKQKKYDNVNMYYLSLGMSGDYTDAVLSGSNMVRIGSAIFGSRQ